MIVKMQMNTYKNMEKTNYQSVFQGSRPVPLENVTTFRDIEDEVTDFVRNGFKPGFQVGLQNFDDIFSTYTGQFITVTGIPSSGKSRILSTKWLLAIMQNYGWKTAFRFTRKCTNIFTCA